MKVTATLFFASAFTAGVVADFATVLTDVKKIQKDVASLYTALKNTQGTSYNEAITIDSAARALNNDLKTANTDAQAVSSVTTTQAQQILTILSNTYANVSGVSKRLIALEPAWKKIGIAGVAKNDISIVAASTKTFGATLVSKAPSSLKSSASALASKYNAALASAVAAYASD